MTKSNADYFEYILHDVFSDIDGITSRSMFGGYGFYKDGTFFSLLADDKLYFKVGANNIDDYKSHGSKPFIYTGHKTRKSVTMSYWEVPTDILEDKLEIAHWVDQAVIAKHNVKK